MRFQVAVRQQLPGFTEHTQGVFLLAEEEPTGRC